MVYAEAYNKKTGGIDEGLIGYGSAASIKSYQNLERITKKLNLQICGQEMGESGYYRPFQDLVKESSPSPSPSPSK